MSLFDAAGLDQDTGRPLADRLRPTELGDVVGQEHLLGPEAPLTRLVAGGHLPSLILWGPPGTGKTTLARLIARQSGLAFEQISAIFSGVADLKKVFATAKARREVGKGTLLFVDEIHRFNKAQQDGFLPHMEDGTIILIGATTENPSFELNGAVLSRAQVLVLHRLDAAALETLLRRAEEETGVALPLTAEARTALIAMADGDGRHLLGLAEMVFALGLETPLDPPGLTARLSQRAPLYDKNREEHYNLISALHKAVRGSDPDAALYWLERMLAGGEDPRYLARRLVRMAVEDVGLADPQALALANSAREAFDLLGSPEGELALAQAAVYLALAPKSNALYAAQKAARRFAKAHGSLRPPAHILNAPTGLMKDLGYGEGYTYDHGTEERFSGQNYFPDSLGERPHFYEPSDQGREADYKARLKHLAHLRAELTKGDRSE